MNYAQLEALIERFTYKPGWKFHLRFEGISQELILSISHLPRNVHSPDEDTLVVSSYYFNPQLLAGFSKLESAVKELLREQVRDMEMHEMNEWLKLDGKCINEPHASK